MPDMPDEGQMSDFADGGGVRKPEALPLPEKLLLELSAAQQHFRFQPDGPAGEASPEYQVSREASKSSTTEESKTPGAQPPLATARARDNLLGRSGVFLRTQAKIGLAAAGRLTRRLRPGDWRRRYIVLLSLLHRHIFDRGIERLLFFKTVYPERYSRDVDGGLKAFVYQGPFPGKVMNWALSALPSDLKRYAFVDFRAGNGRTLLLASRRNFEHATGYAFDGSTCEVLEMNLAQYSRSYMSCRDVRALRADRDGISIPAQPAVLYFPYDLAAGHLAVILDHISASIRAHPRPVYLIFENTSFALDQMQDFQKASLPLLNRIKIALFSPVLVSVCKSANTSSGA